MKKWILTLGIIFVFAGGCATGGQTDSQIVRFEGKWQFCKEDSDCAAKESYCGNVIAISNLYENDYLTYFKRLQAIITCEGLVAGNVWQELYRSKCINARCEITDTKVK